MSATWLSDRKSRLIEKALFSLLLFLFPSQFGYHFWPKFAFLFGIRVDYLSPTVYLTDLIVFFLFLIFFVRSRKSFLKSLQKNLLYVLFFVLFVFLNIFFANNPGPAIYKWLKAIELFFLGYYVFRLKETKKAFRVLSLSVAFFSLPAIFQFLFQKAIGGPLYYLGERTFSVSTPGIALVNIFGREYLRAYSTFSHPNSLAGFFGLFLILLFLSRRKKEKSFPLVGLLGLTGFALAFSWGAFLSLVSVAIFYLIWQKRKEVFKKIPIFIILFSVLLSILLGSASLASLKVSEDVSERFSLAKVSIDLFKKSPFFGVGLNNFIVSLPESESKPSLIWRLQPVHNVFLLVLTEVGALGFSLFVFLFYKILSRVSLKKPPYILPFLFIVLTALADHYWITLQQNELLLSFFLGISLRGKKR